MQSDRLIGVCLQYLLIYAFSFGQFTRAVMPQGKVQGLLEVWGITRRLFAGGCQATALLRQFPLAAFFCSVQQIFHIRLIGQTPDNRIPILLPGEQRSFRNDPVA